MGGLAAGAFFGGRAASRLTPAQALRVYASLELLVAACAIALPLVLRAASPILGRPYGDGPSAIFVVARVAFCLALVSIPAALMGATYPIAIRGCQALPRGGRAERVLYASNAAGAALGAVATGFVLLPALGAAKTIWLGVLVNVIAAAGAMYLAAKRRSPRVSPGSRACRAIARRRDGGPRRRNRHENSPTFPPGPSSPRGSLHIRARRAPLRGRLDARLRHGPRSDDVCVQHDAGGVHRRHCHRCVARRATVCRRIRRCPAGLVPGRVGISTAAALFAVDELPLLIGRWVAFSDGGFVPLIVAEAALAAALLLPATVALGAVFPLGLALGVPSGLRPQPRRLGCTRSTRPGRSSVRCLRGSPSFPRLGCAARARRRGRRLRCWHRDHARRRRTPPTRRCGGHCRGGCCLPRGGAAVERRPAGVRRLQVRPYLRTLDLREALVAGTLLYYREGAAGTVSVRRSGGALSLAIDGKIDASTGGDMLTQKLLAHLPLLIHPNPKRVAIVGLGSGVTAGAALTHPLERLEIIEISPEVVEASRLFDPHSGRPLSDPRARLIVGDARTHFMLKRGDSGLMTSSSRSLRTPGWRASRRSSRANSSRHLRRGSPRAASCASGRTPTTSATPICARSSARSGGVRGHDPLADW